MGRGLEGALRGNELSLDLEDENGAKYTAVLRRADDAWQGTFRGAAGGRCTADEYTGPQSLVLVGRWMEQGVVYRWWLRMYFVDESVRGDE